jgi:ferrous iron transport protein A
LIESLHFGEGIICGGGIMTNLKRIKCGNTVRVVKLEGEGPLRRRIMDMGITKGSDIYVRKVAPLGDPIQISVRNYELTIRKEDAEKILVE